MVDVSAYGAPKTKAQRYGLCTKTQGRFIGEFYISANRTHSMIFLIDLT